MKHAFDCVSAAVHQQGYDDRWLGVRSPKGTSDPPSGQLVEHFVVELLVRLLASHQQEDVAADELVDNL